MILKNKSSSLVACLPFLFHIDDPSLAVLPSLLLLFLMQKIIIISQSSFQLIFQTMIEPNKDTFSQSHHDPHQYHFFPFFLSFPSFLHGFATSSSNQSLDSTNLSSMNVIILSHIIHTFHCMLQMIQCQFNSTIEITPANEIFSSHGGNKCI